VHAAELRTSDKTGGTTLGIPIEQRISGIGRRETTGVDEFLTTTIAVRQIMDRCTLTPIKTVFT